MMRHGPFKHHRPPWWPENEAWPPTRPMRHFPFFRRMGCFFALFTVLGWGVLILVGLTVARSLGWISFEAHPVPVSVPAVLGMILATVMIMGFAGWSLRRVFFPMDNLVQAADRVADGDYSVRVLERGPRAVRSLARAFNKMASRLDSTQSERRNLLADVTHEMRTPLTVIQGNLEGMLDGVYPADEAHLRIALDETELLSRLIADLRTLALAEADALQLKLERTDLADLAREVIATFAPQAATQGVTLFLDAAPELPVADLDPGRMRQVLSNLLANAVRYTPAGGSVRITCSAQDSHLVVDVQDTGAGIAPADLPHIFDRFYRSADSGGMGLGLSIARQLVEAHGGTLTAESAPGKGTSMRIALLIRS